METTIGFRGSGFRGATPVQQEETTGSFAEKAPAYVLNFLGNFSDH